MKKVLIALVRFYQREISGHKVYGSCKYYPTCSNYAIEAIEVHGALKGCALAAYRILRCNPFSKGGYDPVPEKKEKKRRQTS
jgi:putative membrane protein insertion efficiency factor